MPSLAGSSEVPCVRCSTRVPGLAWGEYCVTCLAERRRRATRMARRISQGAGLLVVAWVFLALPSTIVARTWGAVIVVATYLLTRQIAIKLIMEFLPK